MKMNKKGFTLIELLAIIVILAIIAVITVPIILNIINNATKGAEKDSIVGYGKAVELAYTQYQYEEQFPVGESNSYVSNLTGTALSNATGNGSVVMLGTLTLKVDFDGEQVSCASGTITNGKVKLTDCTVNGNGSYLYGNGKACETPSNNQDTDCD